MFAFVLRQKPLTPVRFVRFFLILVLYMFQILVWRPFLLDKCTFCERVSWRPPLGTWFFAELRTRLWPWSDFRSLIGLLSIWHIPYPILNFVQEQQQLKLLPARNETGSYNMHTSFCVWWNLSHCSSYSIFLFLYSN